MVAIVCSVHLQHLESQVSPLHTHPEAHLLQPEGQQEQQPGERKSTGESGIKARFPSFGRF